RSRPQCPAVKGWCPGKNIQHLSDLTPVAALSRRRDRKVDQIRAAWEAGVQIGALRIAARFFDRSIDTVTFKRGMDAYNNPDFYRQLGKELSPPVGTTGQYVSRNPLSPLS